MSIIKIAGEPTSEYRNQPALILWPMVPSHKVETYLRCAGITDERVLSAMRRTRIAEFTPWEFQMPPLMAGIAEQLQVEESDAVLVVGSGTGVFPGLLSKLAASVIGIELDPTMVHISRLHFERLGYATVTVVLADGCLGHPDAAPFDVIVVSAAAAEIPPALWHQLRDGGRMAIPIDTPTGQELRFIRKANDRADIYFRCSCRYDPLKSPSVS